MSWFRQVDQYGLASLITDSISCRPLRALIAVLSIAVAMGGGMTMVGVSESLEATVQQGYAARQVDLMLMQANKSNPMTSRISETFVDQVRKINGVQGVQAALIDSLLLDNDSGILVYGWPPGYQEISYRRGDDVIELQNGQVLIGRTAASLHDLTPGKTIELNLGDFEIIDFFETSSFFESGVLFMRLDDLQQLTSARETVTFIFINLEQDLTESSRLQLMEEVEAIHPILKVVTTEEFLQKNQLTASVRGLGHIILVANALLSLLIISTIMVLTVSERRQELAILRAMGWSATRVSMLVLLETTVLATVAALIGGLVGLVGMKVSLIYVQTLGVYSQSIVTLQQVMWLGISTVVIATIGAALPIYSTLNITTSEALRK